MTTTSPEELLEKLRVEGYRPEARGGQLLLNAPDGVVPEIIAKQVLRVRSKLLRLLGDDVPIPLDELLEDLAQELEQGRQREGYIRTGFDRLDQVMNGIAPSSVVIVAARPGLGKTAFASQVGAFVAKTYGPVMYCSYEMRAKAMARRVTSQVMGVGRREHTAALYRQAKGRIPLYFYDHDKSFSSLVKRIRLFRIMHQNAQLVIIDQLGLMEPPGRPENRVAEVRNISRSLKALALQENIPIMALHQLGRQVDSRTDRRPTRSDLRDSGAVEEDADQILMLYRESYYDKSAGNRVEIGLVKNRDEEDGVWIHFDWQSHLVRYTELVDQPGLRSAPQIPTGRQTANRNVQQQFEMEDYSL